VIRAKIEAAIEMQGWLQQQKQRLEQPTVELVDAACVDALPARLDNIGQKVGTVQQHVLHTDAGAVEILHGQQQEHKQDKGEEIRVEV